MGVIIIIIKSPDQAIASTPSAPRPPPPGAEERGSTAPLCLQLLRTSQAFTRYDHGGVCNMLCTRFASAMVRPIKAAMYTTGVATCSVRARCSCHCRAVLPARQLGQLLNSNSCSYTVWACGNYIVGSCKAAGHDPSQKSSVGHDEVR
jgi:hypothetical protein